LNAIRFYGGEIHSVTDPRKVYEDAERIAAETGGHYLDQFTYAERATDWRGNNNIAESIFSQMAGEDHPVPTWIVCGAGTGGTSATIGRYIHYRRHKTKLCVADPAGSIFHRYYADRTIRTLPEGCSSKIEGIGRPRVEPSFVPGVVDRMLSVSDGESIGAMYALSEALGRRVGGSTGTNLWACAQLISEMAARKEAGSVVTLICDSGDRYNDTYYNEAWLRRHSISWEEEAHVIGDFLRLPGNSLTAGTQ
jgi:cysteine synthase A